jgi:hypothetical protein
MSLTAEYTEDTEDTEEKSCSFTFSTKRGIP